MHQGRAQAVTAGLIAAGVAIAAGALLLSRPKRRRQARMFDYSDRSGFPRPVEQMRGIAQAKKERASRPLSATSPM